MPENISSGKVETILGETNSEGDALGQGKGPCLCTTLPIMWSESHAKREIGILYDSDESRRGYNTTEKQGEHHVLIACPFESAGCEHKRGHLGARRSQNRFRSILGQRRISRARNVIDQVI